MSSGNESTVASTTLIRSNTDSFPWVRIIRARELGAKNRVLDFEELELPGQLAVGGGGQQQQKGVEHTPHGSIIPKPLLRWEKTSYLHTGGVCGKGSPGSPRAIPDSRGLLTGTGDFFGARTNLPAG